MATIRHLTEADLPGVVAMFGRVYPGHRWRSPAELEGYFREMLFANPWRELRLPSWAAEDNGRICGLYAVQPRRMRLNGRALRVAVGCQYMVEPGRGRGLVALELAKACISGPQDLTLADGASEASRRIWTTIGGAVPLLYGLHWTRPLRPARYALWRRAQRAGWAPPLAAALRAPCALVDAAFARLRPNRFWREADPLAEQALEPSVVAEQLPAVMAGCPLQPEYDADALRWLLQQAARKTRHGRLRARAVLDGERAVAGWYLHFVRAGEASEMLQIAARRGEFDRVLRHLLADAWRSGATAVHGRLDPRYAQELSERHCWLRRDGTSLLAHSRHADVVAALHRGEAFVSRLDGEWWMRFAGG